MDFKALLDKPVIRYFTRLYENIDDDYIGLLAAGVAFYFFMAAFPAIAAAISLYGLFSDPVFVTNQLDQLSSFVPPDSLTILEDQARSIANSSEAALGLGFMVGIFFTIYSTTKGIKALMQGLNVVFHLRERRNIVMLNSTAFTLTFVMLAYMLFALSLIALMPAFFNIIHVPDNLSTWLLLLRWPLLLTSAMVGLQILYYYAPCYPKAGKDRPRWNWFSWGALVATLFWLSGSSLFSLFVSNFGSYNETYGSLGAVTVLLLWFWLNALTVLFGAEVNAAFTDTRTIRRGDAPPVGRHANVE